MPTTTRTKAKLKDLPGIEAMPEPRLFTENPEDPEVNKFLFDKNKEPHIDITKKLLKQHPELRQFIGKKNPWTFAIMVVTVSAQFSLAWVMGQQPWWIVVPFAWLFGSMFTQIFNAIVHEASHNLIFRGKFWNMVTGILVNLPMFIPSYVSFKKYHMKHHAFQGVYELDADFPSYWECKMVKNVWWRKALWLLMFPFWQAIRPGRIKEVSFLDAWSLSNIIIVIGVDIAVAYYWGWTALLYLGLCMWLGYGLSVSGGRIIQEHFMVKSPQETYSYYGPQSYVCMNLGYHNEHHDFPSTPWNNLPKIRKIASEHYDSLVYHTSWGKLVLKWIFDPKMSLFGRVARVNRGKAKLNAPVQPDAEAAASS